MAKAKRFYQKEYSKHVGATLFLITSFLGLVFMTCGTPLGVLMMTGANHRSCNTLWGFRSNCWSASYEWRVEEDTCADRRTRWEAAEAFSVIAIFSLLVNIGCAWSIIGGSDIKVASIVVAFFSIGSTTVPWAIVAALYNTHFCGDYTFTHHNRKLGTGFILMVVSFAIQCIGLVLFMFLEPAHQPKKGEEDEMKSLKSASHSSASMSHHTSESADEEQERSSEA